MVGRIPDLTLLLGSLLLFANLPLTIDPNMHQNDITHHVWSCCDWGCISLVRIRYVHISIVGLKACPDRVVIESNVSSTDQLSCEVLHCLPPNVMESGAREEPFLVLRSLLK